MLPLLCSGRCERFKGHYHRVLMVFMAGAALYNAAAYVTRRQQHSAVNALIYSAAVLWEGRHARTHAREYVASSRER